MSRLVFSRPVAWMVTGGGNAELVRILVERGANIRAQIGDRGTPLHLAASKGNHQGSTRPLSPC
eukprot:6558212-Pyramimonas_sp.AAC.1